VVQELLLLAVGADDCNGLHFAGDGRFWPAVDLCQNEQREAAAAGDDGRRLPEPTQQVVHPQIVPDRIDVDKQ